MFEQLTLEETSYVCLGDGDGEGEGEGEGEVEGEAEGNRIPNETNYKITQLQHKM